MTDQISDEEFMRGFWEAFGAPDEETGVRMFQQAGWMDARGSLTELGVAVIQGAVLKRVGRKPSLKGGDVGRRHGEKPAGSTARRKLCRRPKM